jgi:hypothetical protein
MSIEQIVRELEEERNRIDRAIQVLGEVRSGPIFNRAATKPVSAATNVKFLAHAKCPRPLVKGSVSHRKRGGRRYEPERSSSLRIRRSQFAGIAAS